MRLLWANLSLALIAGCLAQPVPEPQAPGPLTPLVATSAFIYHSGAGGVTVIADGPEPKPGSCVLYRNGLAYPEDNCHVRDGSALSGGSIEAAWHVRAEWKRSDASGERTVERLEEKSILAFGASHLPVARWNGTDRHPDFSMAIE